MTVETPFPGRPATPFWDPRGTLPDYGGMGDIDPSQITGDITDVFRTIYSNQPGMYTAQLADGSLVTYRQPTGNVSNLPVGNIGGQLGANLQTNVGSGFGMWALIGIGVFLFIVSRGKR